MKEFLKNLGRHKKEINYLYFGSFFLFLSTLSFFASNLPAFFIFYGFGQALLEVSLLILAAHFLQRFAPRWLFSLYIVASFALALLHFTQFTIVRVMDTTVGYIFRFFFLSGIDHLIAGFQALNMNWTMILIVGFAIVGIPILGLGFYWITHRLAKQWELSLSLNQIVSLIAMVAVVLLTLDMLAYPFLNAVSHGKYKKNLPLGVTFLSPSSPQLPLPRSFLTLREETPILQQVAQLEHKPNLYFFIIETFRKDFLDAAPSLSAFGKENIEFTESFSNANSTHLSWFSLFHATLPFHWTKVRDTWKQGSIPLRYLKELGYKTHIFSSADLHYFGMDKVLFGEKGELADKIEEYSSDRSIEPCDRDALAIQAIEKNLERSGHAYFIFLDSTHSEYSFPKDFPLRFEPSAKTIDYLTIGANSPDLEAIKNRYRNSISYVDTLMGQFFSLLKKENLYEDAIIAITGDHGEEFFEEGALFHGTHLNRYQTSVPLFLKFPSSDWVSQTKEATHIDMFPSILHYLTNRSDFSSLMDGKSIFVETRAPVRIAVLHNGSETPKEFAIYNRDFSLQARLISDSQLEIIQQTGTLEEEMLNPLMVQQYSGGNGIDVNLRK